MKIKKRYLILAFIILLFASERILKYYKMPRYKTIPNVKLENFSLEKQWEHVKKAASIKGDGRVNHFSLEISKSGTITRYTTSLYVKKKSGAVEEVRLMEYDDIVHVSIYPLKKNSVNIEEYISMDESVKASDNIYKNLHTIFKTPGKEYIFLFSGKLAEYKEIETYNKVPIKTYSFNKTALNLKALSKKDLPMRDTISILCIKPIEVYPFEERVDVVYEIFP